MRTSRWAAAAVLAFPVAAAGQAWRSELYPADWTPGFEGPRGGSLPDFSYAGYRRGEEPIPSPTGPVVDVTAPPFGADRTGVTDATPAIQAAIDEVQRLGGGVVHLPAGTYRVRPQGDARRAALHVSASGVVLRGDGPGRTFIWNDETTMRGKDVIRVAPAEDHDHQWVWDPPAVAHLAVDAVAATRTLELRDLGDLAVGEWVVVRSDATPAFVSEHRMDGHWSLQSVGGPCVYRRIVAIDRARRAIELDIPTRYPLLTRDLARVHRTRPHLSEVGVERLSIGMRRVEGGLDDDDWNTPGKREYRIHDSHALKLNHVVDGWVREVSSYEPPGNGGVHILSNGLILVATRNVTVEAVHLASAQYRGAGGNGYLFTLQGSDTLLTGCSAARSRHNYSLSMMWATGNVITGCSSSDARLPSDFHMQLSPSNLVELVTFSGDHLSALRRNHVRGHGQVTSGSVFWNVRGRVESQQFGRGWVIGCASVHAPSGDPDGQPDHVEGTGRGAELEPQSLHADQLRRRLSASPPVPEDEAAIARSTLPRSAPRRRQVTGFVTVRNTGRSTWTGPAFALGAVGDGQGATARLLGTGRIHLPPGVSIAPGQEHRFRVTVRGQPRRGRHRLELRMVHEGVRWFGETLALDFEVR